MKKQKFVFVDAETTGFDETAQIIELAAARVDWPSFEIESLYYQRFKPTIDVEEEAARINGYTPAAWEGAPKLEEAHARFLSFMDFVTDCRWVGSVPWYDFDKAERMRKVVDPSRKWALVTRRCIDVGSLGSPLILAGYGDKGGLDELCEVLNIRSIDDMKVPGLVELCGGRLGPHTAMGDVGRTIRVFRRLMTSFVSNAVMEPILRD